MMIEGVPSLNSLRLSSVFWRTLRDNIPGALAWGAGYSTLLVTVVFLYPVLQENNTLLSLINGLGLLEMLTEIYFVDPRSLGTFHGYLALEGLAWAPLILAVYLIPQAMRVALEEEYVGTLDLLLSTPLPRTRLIIEKTLAVIASLAMILAMMWISLLISSSIVKETQLTFSQATSGIWNMLPICLTIFSLTLLLSVTLRNSRTVGGMAALIVIGSLFMRSLADATSAPLLEHLRHVSMFHYYVVLAVLLNGITWRPILILTGVSVILLIVSVWLFNRRDLAV